MPPLITAPALQALLPQGPLLLDWRFDLSDPGAGQRAHAQGHLPGAHYLHLDKACGPKQHADGRFAGRHPLPSREDFATLLHALGWHPGRHVVCYDGGNSMFAARGWWMLKWLGHEAVQVLDGGWTAWQAAGGAVDQGPVAVQAASALGPLGALPPAPLATLDADALQRQLTGLRLIDARAPERFRGETEPLDAVPGHIPGARNRPFALNLQADGRFKPAAQLRDEWASLQPDARTVHQCGSGVTACHNLLALAVAGLPVGVLYPGSWSEWCADPTRPVARG